MSTLEVNKITPQGTATEITLGDSGDTFTIPSGVTLTNNGTANFGKIGQVISTTKTDTFSTTSTSSTDITGMSVSITPTSTSSKIYINASLSISTSAIGVFYFCNLLRDSTEICLGDADGSRDRVTTHGYAVYGPQNMGTSVSFLDSPNTTSSITYKFQLRVSSGTGYLNRDGDDADSSNRGRDASTITVMEVLA